MLVLKVVLPSASLVLHGGFTSKWGVEKTKITKKRPWWPHLENAYSAKTIRCYSHLASLLSRDFKLWKNLKTVLRVFLKCFLLLSALKCVGMRNRRTSWEQKTAFLGKKIFFGPIFEDLGRISTNVGWNLIIFQLVKNFFYK